MVIDRNNQYLEGQIGGVTVTTKRADGWMNALTGLGKKGVDKTESTQFGIPPQFTDEELSNLYEGEGMGARIIDLPAKDSIRSWINTPGDPARKILNELKRLKAPQMFRKALSYTRLYRGAIIVMVEQGVLDLAKPLQKNLKGLSSLRVYSAARIEINDSDISIDPRSKYFDEIEIFNVRLRNGTTIPVHASRCLIFKGFTAPDEGIADFKYKYWGFPVMKRIYDRLKNWGSVEKSVITIMLEFNIGKYSLSNLEQMLSQNDKESMDAIYNRIDIIQASKSIINAVLLGKDETYDRDTVSVAGIKDIMEMMMISLSAVSEIPVTRLWGRSPAGENATGESDMRQYYDDISANQETDVEPALQKLINVIGVYENVQDTSFKFNPLWQPTKKEQADIDKITAETDQIYITTAVRTPEEITDQRFPDKTTITAGVE